MEIQKNEPLNKLNENVLPESSDFDIIAIQLENMHTNIMKSIAKAQDKQSRDYDLKHGAGSSLCRIHCSQENESVEEAWNFVGMVLL